MAAMLLVLALASCASPDSPAQADRSADDVTKVRFENSGWGRKCEFPSYELDLQSGDLKELVSTSNDAQKEETIAQVTPEETASVRTDLGGDDIEEVLHNLEHEANDSREENTCTDGGSSSLIVYYVDGDVFEATTGFCGTDSFDEASQTALYSLTPLQEEYGTTTEELCSQ